MCQRYAVRAIVLAGLLVPSGVAPAARTDAFEKRSDPEAEFPTEYVLRVTPAPLDEFPLRYRFRPEIEDRTPGNAATRLLRAVHWVNGADLDTWFAENVPPPEQPSAENGGDDEPPSWTDWLTTPLEEWPARRVFKFLDYCSFAIEEAVAASRCDEIGWDLRARDAESFEAWIATATPEVFTLRELGRVLAVAERHAIYRRDWGRFARYATAAFGLADALERRETLIERLVAASIDELQSDVVAEAIARCPDHNWYAAIAELDRRPRDLTAVIELEMNAPYRAFPVAKDAATKNLSFLGWVREWNDAFAMIPSLTAHDVFAAFDDSEHEITGLPDFGLLERLRRHVIWRMVGFYKLSTDATVARGFLAVAGHEPEKLMRLGDMQVVAMFAEHIIETNRQRLLLAAALPASERGPLIARFESALDTLGERTEHNLATLPSLLVTPLVGRAMFVCDGRQDRFTALRLVEALRAHAAVTGAWPESLEEIATASVPLRPLTGRPFLYRREGETAVIDLPHEQAARRSLRFTLQLVGPGKDDRAE